MADNTKYIDSSADLKSGKEALVQMEYVIARYFEKNIAPKADQAMKRYEKKLNDISGAVLKRTIPGDFPIYTSADRQKAQEAANCFYEEIKADVATEGTKIFKDMGQLTDIYRNAMVLAVGKAKYLQASEQLGQDAAVLAISHRIEQLQTEHLSRKYKASNSFEYIMDKGLRNSFISTAISWITLPSPVREQQIKAGEGQYNANGIERFAAGAVGVTADALTFGGLGLGTSTASRTIMTLFTLGDVYYQANAAKTDSINPGETEISSALFGHPDTLKQAYEDSKDDKKVQPRKSELLHAICKNVKLNLSMKLPTYRVPYSPHAAMTFRATLNKKIAGNGQNAWSVISGHMKEYGIKVNEKQPIPKWIAQGNISEEGCSKNAAFYYSIALEMRNCGSAKILLNNGKTITREEAFQRAYDYARAANAAHAKNVKAVTEAQERERTVAAAQQKQIQQQQQQIKQQQQQIQQAQQVQQPQPVMPNQQNMSGWGQLMNRIGMGDMGETSTNLGYIFAMMPDMLINMFTGRSNVNFKNALLPVSAFALGMFFFKNPILKVLLMAFGATSLLSKAGNKVMRETGVKSNSTEFGGIKKPFYRSYADEPLNSRVQHPVMRGNTLVFDIDGTPTIATIDDTTADAYYKKKIPINTLANAVLQKYDAQQSAAEGQYAAQQEQQQQANSVALR